MSIPLPEPPYFAPRDSEQFRSKLAHLTEFHRSRCQEYNRIIDGLFPFNDLSGQIEDQPYVPIGLFRMMDLHSISDEETFRIIKSSGTTSSKTSAIRLDKGTSRRQSVSLQGLIKEVLQTQDRLPMLVVDCPQTARQSSDYSARSAGVIGLMMMGRDHSFALSQSGDPDIESLSDFSSKTKGQRKLAFGFTFMVWQHLVRDLDYRFDFSGMTLFHSGGWKKMESEGVTNEAFKAELRSRFGDIDVRNFYGMAEQVGSIFIEGEDGYLHTSALSSILIRDPLTLEPVPDGTPGLIQVMSLIPLSYPGHSILTEDLGVIEHRQSYDRLGGIAFRVLGRLPRAQLRGCSDTYGVQVA